MADEIEYQLAHVPATPVASEDIDTTFRSSCIGPSCPHEPYHVISLRPPAEETTARLTSSQTSSPLL